MKKFLKKQAGYLLSGVIIWLPIVILVIIGAWIFNVVDNIGEAVLDVFRLSSALPKGEGFFLMIFLIYLSGMLFRKTAARKFVAKIPILGFFVGQEGTMMSLERLLTLQPCLFLYSPTCPSYGFILSEEKVTLNSRESSLDLLNIYFPNVPTMIMGQIFPVRRETVIKIGNSAGEIVNILLYSFKIPENIAYLPWENETQEDFRQRAEKFGLNNSGASPKAQANY